MERKTAAGREAHQHELRVRVLGAHRGDKISHVVVELARIVDVAARAGVAVATNVGRVDRNARGAERFAKRMNARALRRGTVDGDDHKLGIRRGGFARPDAVRDRRAVARLNFFRLRQIAEIRPCRNGAPSEASGSGAPLVPNASMPASAATIATTSAHTTITTIFAARLHGSAREPVPRQQGAHRFDELLLRAPTAVPRPASANAPRGLFPALPVRRRRSDP